MTPSLHPVATTPVAPELRRYVDAEGRAFEYAICRHAGARGLGVHFSAFTGAWGNQRRYRETYSGYFHRLRMLGSHEGLDWLFLSDPFGVGGHGCYYAGERGDLFVERAVMAITEQVTAELHHPAARVVTIGSSMGATGALLVGMAIDAAGIVAISPHIDLRISALHCDRYAEVVYACPDGDPTSEASRAVTERLARRLAELRDARRTPPRLFVQSCADDAGVHAEQVVPFLAEWRAAGGQVDWDLRLEGGHTSDYATRPLLLDVVERLLGGTDIPAATYATDQRFASRVRRDPVHTVRHLISAKRRGRAIWRALTFRR